MAGAQSGGIILPGFVDPHVHLREPSTNTAETIAHGTRAAIYGGFVLVGDMPNNPGHETWSLERLEEKHRIASESSWIPTTFHAGSQPESDNVGQLADMAERSLMLKIYAGRTTGNHKDYDTADFEDIVLEWHRATPTKPIGLHAGNGNLEDFIGLIAQDLGHPLHVHHISDPSDVGLVLSARSRGLKVTSGVTPHHLIKTSHDQHSEGWFARMKPPLASQADSERLMAHLASGRIDIVETDHAPHPPEKKWEAEEANPSDHPRSTTTCYGVPGIELAAPLLFYQAFRGRISMDRLVDAMSTTPARLLGVKLHEGTKVAWDMHEFMIENNGNSAQGYGNSPYLGKLAVGKVKAMTIHGSTVFSGGSALLHTPRVVTRRRSII